MAKPSVVGHLTSKKFVDQWGEGEDSFADDPPNAVVSFLENGDETPGEVTMANMDPSLLEEYISTSGNTPG